MTEFSWAWLWFITTGVFAIMYGLERLAHNNNCAAFGVSYSILTKKYIALQASHSNPFRRVLSEVVIRCAENGIAIDDIFESHSLTLGDVGMLKTRT